MLLGLFIAANVHKLIQVDLDPHGHSPTATTVHTCSYSACVVRYVITNSFIKIIFGGNFGKYLDTHRWGYDAQHPIPRRNLTINEN